MEQIVEEAKSKTVEEQERALREYADAHGESVKVGVITALFCPMGTFCQIAEGRRASVRRQGEGGLRLGVLPEEPRREPVPGGAEGQRAGKSRG